MLSSARGPTQAPSVSVGTPDPDERAEPRRARDRQSPADLGRTAAHRVEAEVAGMAGGRVEPPPVVADLDEDHARPELPPARAPRSRRRASDDVGQRLAPDREQLGLDELATARGATPGPDLDRRARPSSAQSRGVPRERRNQPVVDRVAAQLEDERAHLALHALGEVRDRAERLRDAPGRARRPPDPAPSAPCACAAPSRTGPGRPNRADRGRSGAAPPRPARPRVLRASASSLDDRSRSLTTALRNSVVSAATPM